MDEKIFNGFFWYFLVCEKCVLVQVCKVWWCVFYQFKFWVGFMLVLYVKEFYNVLFGGEKEFVNLQGFVVRGFEGFCLVGVFDLDICEFIDNYVFFKKGVKVMSFKCFIIMDVGFEVMFEQMQGVVCLELLGCNDFIEVGLWFSLSVCIILLSVSDCINVVDDVIVVILQLLFNLVELSLQVYYVMDMVLVYFMVCQGYSMYILCLFFCWEIINYGVVNVVYSLFNFIVFSFFGCFKVIDDGVEFVVENLCKLCSFDFLWCLCIIDMVLEYVVCDLYCLEEFVFDRCVCIMDIGFSYLFIMLFFCSFYL